MEQAPKKTVLFNLPGSGLGSIIIIGKRTVTCPNGVYKYKLEIDPQEMITGLLVFKRSMIRMEYERGEFFDAVKNPGIYNILNGKSTVNVREIDGRYCLYGY
jgi:hypothetical protein